MSTKTVSVNQICNDVIEATLKWAKEHQTNQFYERHEVHGSCINNYEKATQREWDIAENDVFETVFLLFEQLGFGRWAFEQEYKNTVIESLSRHHIDEYDEDADPYAYYFLIKPITLTIPEIIDELERFDA